ncbi:OmpA family protein [Marinobacter alexandrii]|uniref:OmpA family protein n=3 Tax=Marinobacter TaxID=2742 RepID=UPI00326361CD
MKAAIGLVLFSAIITGCTNHQRASVYPALEAVDEAKARGIADHYYIAADIAPSENDTFDHFQRDQDFRRGCALDFYTLLEPAPKQRRWQLRERSLQSGHLGTYRRFVSESAYPQGKHNIPAQLAEDLEWFAKELIRSPLMPFVLIIGHTNSDGSASYNQALSEKRATAAHQFLISQGVPENRVLKFGVGETSPLQMLDAKRSRLLNRRVELVTFIPSDVSLPQSRCTPAWDLALSNAKGESQQ